MIKNLFIFLFLFIWSGQRAFTQPPVPKDVNALYHQLQLSNSDTSRVNLLIKIVRYYNAAWVKQPIALDSALVISNRALSLSEKISYQEGIGLSSQVMAQVWCNKKDFRRSDALIKNAVAVFLTNGFYRDAAEAYLNMEEFYQAGGGKDLNVRINYYEKAQPLFHKAGAYDREAATLKVLGDFYQVQGDINKAYTALQQSLALYQKTNVKELQGLYDLLGYTATQLGDYQIAIKYGLLAVKTAESVNDNSMELCTIYNRLALTYNRLAQYQQSAKYYASALKVATNFKDTSATLQVVLNYASSLVYIHKSAQGLQIVKYYSAKYPTVTKEEQLMILTTFVILYLDLKQVAVAGIYCNKMLILVNSPGIDKNVQMSVQLPATKYFIAAKQFQNAHTHLLIYKRLNEEAHLLSGLTSSYKYAFKIDSAEKRYLSAIDNYQQFILLRDSVYNIKKSKQIEELKIKYETEKKERQLSLLSKDEQVQRDKMKQANHINNLTFGGAFILLTLLIVLYISYRSNQKKSKLIGLKNVSLNQLLVDKDHLLEEKEWLLKEIHHRVKNNLQIVTGLLQRQSAYIDNDAALAAIQNSENRMHAIALIHQKLYQSESLGLINMPEYIEEMISYLRDSCDLDNRIVFEKHLEDISLDVAQAVPLGLILNEAITNAIKYAYPANEGGIIYVTFVSNDNHYNQLTIADNGPGLANGFDINKVDSLGLNLMRGLCKQLGGSFEISSEQGCTINIIFKTEIFSKAVNRG